MAITLDREIPPIPAPRDTKSIRHVKIRSELLTKFWGRPMELGACLLLPEGFDDYDTELIMHFNDDDEREHTDDIIFLTEFIKEQFPGVVLYNDADRDVF